MFGWWLLLRVRQRLHGDDGRGGGINGVMAFHDPTVKNAQRTLTMIVALLAILLIGIALLCRRTDRRDGSG